MSNSNPPSNSNSPSNSNPPSNSSPAASVDEVNPSQSLLDVFKAFLALGFTSFGGPVAHIGYFHREFVERRQWLSDSQFSQLLAVCQFLPGPASSQLGFAIGLLNAGWLGAMAAFIAFTLPSAVVLVVFASMLDAMSGAVAQSAIHGLKLVACVVVADAVLGMSKKLCPDNLMRGVAIMAASLVLLLGSAWAQLLVIVLGAMIGLVYAKGEQAGSQDQIRVGYSQKKGLFLLSVFAGLLLFSLFLSNGTDLTAVAGAFYRAGALVFGGGHVVLPLLEESALTSGWMSQQTFLAGYGAAQAVPGPMFSFAAYLGALIPTGHSSVLGASVALLFMFIPGFLLLAAVLPLWQGISANEKALKMIAGVNAAVVGVLAAALYDPVMTSGLGSNTDMAIAILAFGLLTVLRLSALYVVLFCVLASVLTTLI